MVAASLPTRLGRKVTIGLAVVLVSIVPLASCDDSGTVVLRVAAPDAPGPDASAGPFGDSPPVTSTSSVAGLEGPVDVVRDTHGFVHIWATTSADALRVEGYQVAKDRTSQLELLRRFAEGRVAEILGDLDPTLVDQDIAMRMIGLQRVAQQMYDAVPAGSELRTWIDAYASGISQFFARVQTGEESLPSAMVGIPHAAFTPWTGVDSLAIARLIGWELQYTGDSEIAQTDFVQTARTTWAGSKRSGFNVDVLRFAPLDPTLAMAGFPDDPTDSHAPAPARPPRTGRSAVRPGAAPNVRVAPELLMGARPFIRAAEGLRQKLGKLGVRGSNDWVVGPSRTATGHAMLANDPHLQLSAPPLFWMVQLDVHDPSAADTSLDLHAAGSVFPGIPGVILGFNQNVAWGGTTTDYDASDVYTEQLTPDGSAVLFKGQSIPLQTVHEVINVAGGSPVSYDVLIVPQHGPIVPTIVNHQVVPPDPKKGALSVAWTGSKPTGEAAAFAGFLRAKTVDDFRAAIRTFGVGSLNWVVGDTNGDIFYTSQSQIPLRDKRAYTWDPTTFSGTLPCFVEPGDGTAEWTGTFLDEAFVPHEKNPSAAYIGTANGDPVGGTLDNDPSNDVLPNGQPIYLACWHDVGFRVGRIHELIESLGHPMTPTDIASMQADVRSSLGAQLAPGLVTSLDHALAEAASPGTHPDLTALVSTARFKAAPVTAMRDLLVEWAAADYGTPAGVSLDDGSVLTDASAVPSQATLVFQTWLVRASQAILGDELTKIGQNPPPFGYHDLRAVVTYLLTADPKTLATFDPATGDSALFDDLTTAGMVESRDLDCVVSLLDALDFLGTKLGADPTRWRWGSLHTLTFVSLDPLWGALSVPPAGSATFPAGFPRHGDGFNIDVGEPDATPVSLAAATFTYSAGPTQRFVIDIDPAGPVARNVLPGGEIWDNTSPHFADDAELWRRNQNHAFPFSHADVEAAAESRAQYTP